MKTEQLVLETGWVVVERIDAMPDTLADVADAYTVGWAAAEQGKPCEPTKIYAKLGDIANYELGWHEGTAAMQELAEYIDEREEQDFNRRGGWN